MTVPSGGGSRPISADPTAVLPTAGQPAPGAPAAPPRDVPPRDVRPPHARPPHAAPPLVPVAAPPVRGATPPRDRDRDGTERRRRKPPLAWLPWALLAALLVLLALVLLAGTLAGAERATSGARGAAAPAAPDDATAGTLRVGDADLLAGPEALGRLATVQGEDAVGRGLRVQSVVADEGFWVGSSTTERLFVYLSPEARASSGESRFQVREGQRVDVNGRIIGTSPGDPALFGVTDAEGARQLTSQRAYLRATQVRLSP